MERKDKVYTLEDPRYMDRTLEAFCKRYDKTRTIVHGKNEDSNWGKIYISKKRAEFLEREGLTIEIIEDYGYRRIEEFSGIPIDIRPVNKGTRDYRKGIKISIPCYGESNRTLQKDIDRKQNALFKYLDKYDIPLDRVCIGDSYECEYKF